MNLGKAIKELRKNQSISQSDLADRVGITQSRLSQIEKDERPTEELLGKICKELGVPQSMVYAMGMEKGDVPEEKALLYDKIFPVIQGLILQVAGK